MGEDCSKGKAKGDAIAANMVYDPAKKGGVEPPSDWQCATFCKKGKGCRKGSLNTVEEKKCAKESESDDEEAKESDGGKEDEKEGKKEEEEVVNETETADKESGKDTKEEKESGKDAKEEKDSSKIKTTTSTPT